MLYKDITELTVTTCLLDHHMTDSFASTLRCTQDWSESIVSWSTFHQIGNKQTEEIITTFQILEKKDRLLSAVEKNFKYMFEVWAL